MSTKHLLRFSACAVSLILMGILSNCASRRNPENFARDDYFGGQGNLTTPLHHVPREVQRTDPWLPLF